MPEIPTSELPAPVSCRTEIPDRKMNAMECCNGEETYGRSDKTVENETFTDKREASFLKLSTVRDNIQSAHEKIMNGQYDEILTDRETQNRQYQVNNEEIIGGSTEDTTETSENDEIIDENDVKEYECETGETISARSLKDLISKEVLETLSQEQCDKIANDVIHCYDPRVYHPIRPGQRGDEVNVPIMSPPPTEEAPKYELGEFRTNFCRSLAAEFIKSHDLKECNFDSVQSDYLLKTLAFPNSDNGKLECICACQNTSEDLLSGWGTPQKFSKSKSGKKRKSIRVSSGTAFSRLTGQLIYDKDPFSFQHFKDSRKYIEHYRFLHTVGGVCSHRPLTTKATLSRNTEEEIYYNKLRSAFCAMASSFDLRTLLQGRENASSSSSDRNDRAKSDDDSVEESTMDNKVLSMKDRGKALNLAPVRECTVPDLIQAESMDQLQQNYATINQYLNLMTPPLPADCLRIAYEAAKASRNGGRLSHSSDSHFFQPPSPRRATPLRLGSAEFVKPGTPEHRSPPDLRWSNERKASMQRASTFHAGTVPGNLYVGSTVTTSPAHVGRSKSTRHSTSSLNQSHSHYSHNSKEAPHLVYGKKFKPCERMNELTRERTKGRDEKVVPVYQSPSGEQNNIPRKQDKLISVNFNHLGIRGRTFKNDELNVFYKFDKEKNRRVATLTSNF